MKIFIVEFWSPIFYILRRISPGEIIRKKVQTPKRERFVEGWVLGNLLLSIILLLACSAPNLIWWEAIAICWSGIRIFEVFIYQINVLLFDQYRAGKEGKHYALRGFHRIVILLLHNYVEIIFWFAIFYRNFGYAFETGEINLNSFFVSLNFSFTTMTTFGYSNIYPKENLGYILILIQSIIGLFMALLILARFISLLPIPGTLNKYEK